MLVILLLDLSRGKFNVTGIGMTFIANRQVNDYIADIATSELNMSARSNRNCFSSSRFNNWLPSRFLPSAIDGSINLLSQL